MIHRLLLFALLITLVSCTNQSTGNVSAIPVDLKAILDSIYFKNQSNSVSKTLQYTGEEAETKSIDSTAFRDDLKFLESFALNERSFADQFRQTGTQPLSYEATSKKTYVRSIVIWPRETQSPDSIQISYAMQQITGTRYMDLSLIPASGFRLEVREDNRMQKNLNFMVQEVWR
ncbi:MAG: hypothetical protein KDC59_07450 [Saprospiraceae bacterium]|nr:hypothetical protein [Saprospiraceae bacterium]HPQ98351.1 hypothetical protein [Saprospiraceae bacterium]HPQ99885.1 hypothetical protein [Saprospiraceae bacterium]